MTEAEPFLRAIREAPHDDGPRLVYADWLDERGDPRGEFIRLQCELEGMADDDARRTGYERRQKLLLDRHGPAWRKQLRWGARRGPFWRGFVKPELALAARQFLNRGPDFFRPAPLWDIRLAYAGGLISELAACPSLRLVNGLLLTRNVLTDADVKTLVMSPAVENITHLGLAAVPIGPDALRYIADSPHLGRLRVLDLSYNFRGWDAIDVEAALWDVAASPGLTALRTVYLDCARIDPAVVQALEDRYGQEWHYIP